MVSGLVIALLCRGHVLEGVPGVAKTLVRCAGGGAATRFQTCSSPRPDARGCHRITGVRRAHRGLRVPRGAGVHQPAGWPTRSNRISSKTQAAPAGGQWRTSGQRRRAAAADPLIVAATQNPDRVRHLSAARGAAGPLPRSSSPVPLPPRDQEGGDPVPASRTDFRSARPVGDPPVAGPAELAADARRCRWQVLVADEVPGYIVDIAGPPGTGPALNLVSHRAARDGTAGHTARSWAWLSGRATSRPTMSRRWRTDTAAPALRPEAELEGATWTGCSTGSRPCRYHASSGTHRRTALVALCACC